MKLSFSTLGCPGYTMDQIIAMAADNGYEGIELRAVEGTVELWSLPAFTGGGLGETAKKLRDKGLSIACIGSNISFAREGEDNKAAQLETAKHYLDMLHALDCPYLRTFGGPLTATMGYLESIEQIQDGYEALCDLLGREGIMPLLETHDDFSASARMMNIIGGVSSDNLGIVWDILHPLRFGEAVADTYAGLKEKIRHVHIKDSVEYSPKGFDLVLTGKGKVPIADCVGLLRDGGYTGYLSYEWEKMWHPEIEEPEIALPDYAKVMAQYR